jgi:aminoglycoside phosphotransferase (APT) family kinase protein
VARKKTRGKTADADDFEGPTDCWVSYGGEMLWAMGYTSNGVPYGLSEDEMREVEAGIDLDRVRRERGQGFARSWSDAKDALSRTFRALSSPTTKVFVGRLTCLGRGLTRRQFAAAVELTPDRASLSDTYVVGLPLEADAALEGRLAAEAAVLDLLARHAVPFRVPRPVRAPGPHQTATIRTFVPGVELDLRAGRQPGVRPWQVVGELAAAVHQVPLKSLYGRVPTFTSRKDFALHQVTSLNRGRHHPDVAHAIAWAASREPPNGVPTLIHGDLLGQNILLAPGHTPALVDWEHCAIGDPAYDLAVVTRGVKRPFQIDRGLERLLEAYGSNGGGHVAARDVHFYEVCLAAGWVCDELASKDNAMIEHATQPLQSLLRRFGGAPPSV